MRVVFVLAVVLGLAGCAAGACASASGGTDGGHGELSRRARRHRLRRLHRPDGRGGFRRGAGAVSGYLDTVNFKEGALVKKDDKLFEIDPRPYRAELERAKGTVASSRPAYTGWSATTSAPRT